MKLKVQTYAETVDTTRRVLGYHPVNRGHYAPLGCPSFVSWPSLAEFYLKNARHRHDFQGRHGRALRFDLGRQYGIHSYTEVTEVE